MVQKTDNKVVVLAVRPQPARVVVNIERDLAGLGTSPRELPIMACEREGKKYKLPAAQSALESAVLLALRAYRNLFSLTFNAALLDYRQHVISNPWTEDILDNLDFTVTIAKANGIASTITFHTVLTILDGAVVGDSPNVSDDAELEVGEEI